MKKLRADIGKIKANFQGILAKDKVYVHLKDLNLLRDFIQCDLALIKNLCKQLKK